MNLDQYRALLTDLLDLRADDVVGLDTEGTSLRPWGDNVLRGVAVAYRKAGGLVSHYVPLTHPASDNLPFRPLAEALQQCRALQVWWNYGYDAAVMERAGVPRAERYRDGMVVSWLMDENEPRALKKQGALRFGEDEAEEQRALKELMRGETKAEVYKRLRADGLSVAEAKERSEAERRPGRTWADLTAADIETYARKDTELTLRLDEWQRAQPEYARIEPAIQRHHDLDGVVHRMTKRGVAVDVDLVRSTRERYLREMDVIQAEFGDVCLDSAPQLSKLIYETWALPVVERTKTGAPSTSRDAIDLLEGAHPGLDRILQYRKYQKAVGTYFDRMLDEVDCSYDGRIHISYNTVGTVTGRFAAGLIMQIPRGTTNSDVGGVFTAAPGYELWSFDQSQAELRTAASIAGETTWLDIFDGPDPDIYQATADELACDETCIRNSKNQCVVHRQSFKTVVLASQYSVGARKLTRTLKRGQAFAECEFWTVMYEDRKAMRLKRCGRCDVCETQNILWDFWGSVPMLAATRDQLTRAAEALRYVPLHEPGRFRRYPTPAECRARNLARWPKTYTALNSVVQGGAAEVLKSWLLAAEPELDAIGARLVMTVHDSVVVEVPSGAIDEVHVKLQTALDDSIPAGWCRIPLERKQGV